MKTFEEFIAEAASTPKRTAVVTYGRFNPPTIGHDKLVKKTLETPGDEHHIIVSHSQDDKKNPLHAHERHILSIRIRSMPVQKNHLPSFLQLHISIKAA